MVELLKINRTIFVKSLEDLEIDLSIVPSDIRSRIYTCGNYRSSAYGSRTFPLPRSKNSVGIMYNTECSLEQAIECLNALGISCSVRELEGDYLVAVKTSGQVYDVRSVYPHICDYVSTVKLRENIKTNEIEMINF